MHFEHLRKTPWAPTFEWVKTSYNAADKINSYHEDYPKYVEITDVAIRHTASGCKIDSLKLRNIHKVIFDDKSFAGKWRDVDVVVGEHRPPKWSDVAELMDTLHTKYTISSLEELLEWYRDFETIHPFQDGNGRVGGVIVAAYSHALGFGTDWLAPNQ